MTPTIGIVTVLYNSSTVLPEFFETLNQQTFADFKLYVIDNASSDESLKQAQKLAKKVNFPCEIIAESTNWGIAKGNNIGIHKALEEGCQYILLSNNDIVLEPSSISNLWVGLQQSEAAMAVPKIYFHGTDLIWAAGGKFVYHTGCTWHIGYLQHDNDQYNTKRNISYAPTCFMLIKRQVFQDIGFMDEAYFVYYDDTDFVWRATQKHLQKLVYIPESRIWHKESTSTGGPLSDFYIYYMSRNMVYFARKHLGLIQKTIIFSYYSLHYLLRKSFKMDQRQRKIVRKAYLDGLRMPL